MRRIRVCFAMHSHSLYCPSRQGLERMSAQVHSLRAVDPVQILLLRIDEERNVTVEVENSQAQMHCLIVYNMH